MVVEVYQSYTGGSAKPQGEFKTLLESLQVFHRDDRRVLQLLTIAKSSSDGTVC